MDLRPKPADAVLTGAPGPAAQPGSLAGIRVIEMADEQAEYCGLTLAGLYCSFTGDAKGWFNA